MRERIRRAVRLGGAGSVLALLEQGTIGRGAKGMRPIDPYKLLGENCIINFSGGRSSAFMLWHLLDRYDGELPPFAQVAFANTGVELPETLNFVEECSRRWNVPVTWLEYEHHKEAKGGRADPKHRHRIVSHNAAARNKEPFEAMIAALRPWNRLRPRQLHALFPEGPSQVDPVDP